SARCIERVVRGAAALAPSRREPRGQAWPLVVLAAVSVASWQTVAHFGSRLSPTILLTRRLGCWQAGLSASKATGISGGHFSDSSATAAILADCAADSPNRD